MAARGVALQAVALSKSYGTVRACRDISFTARTGRIHAVVGENGAGKSTLVRMLQGVERPDAGTIRVGGEAVAFASPAAALARGIGLVHQEFTLAPDLTLLENLVPGAEPVRMGYGPFARIDWARAHREGQHLARKIGAFVDWRQRTASAPLHVLQCVEIIRLLRRGCDILILDEPTAVLAPPRVTALFALLRNLRAAGTTLVFISHKIDEVTALADEVTVIRRGETVFHANMAETSADEIAAHIVRGVAPHTTGRPSGTIGAPLLRVRNLSTPGGRTSRSLRDVSLAVRAGEILGIAGVSGNGQTGLVECIAGLRPAASGVVQLGPHDITALTPAERRLAGLGYISADRRHEGLCPEAGIAANVVAGSHRTPPVRRGVVLRPRALRDVARQRLGALNVIFGHLHDPVSSLSGGNQQKLVFAREIGTSPRVLLAAQPTRGVDLNGIAAIHALLRDFRDRGGAVLLVSGDLDELVALADRILVLARGRVVGEMPVSGVPAPGSPVPGAEVARIGRLMVGAA